MVSAEVAPSCSLFIVIADLVEYEMDLDDEKWLADWNQHNPGTLIEVDDFELYLDRLEKARARPAPRGPR